MTSVNPAAKRTMMARPHRPWMMSSAIHGASSSRSSVKKLGTFTKRQASTRTPTHGVYTSVNAARHGRALGNQGVGDARGKLIEAQHLIQRRIAHDLCHQCGMHGMTCAFGDHMTEQRFADQRQIADEIERLVPAAFVVES